MEYKRFDLSDSNLSKGMIVSRKSKTYQALWSIYRNRKLNKWIIIYRGYVCIKNKNSL